MSNEKLLVTGATGLVGSTLCVAAAKAGYQVRGMVRSRDDVAPLEKAGVEIVQGDVTDSESVMRAADGADVIVHTAALIGGTWSKATPEELWQTNYVGVVNVLDAARKHNVRRTVCYSSMAILDWRFTATNTSPILAIEPGNSPYQRAKRAAFYASMHRASVDQDIITVVPGGIYGPAPIVDRAVVLTSYTGTLLLAIRGGLDQYVEFPSSWSFVDDVAGVGLAALERGTNGSRYLAVGRVEDLCSLVTFCNRACELAGVAHRVKPVDLTTGGAEIGIMRVYAERKHPTPYLDTSETTAALGISPTPLKEGLQRTVTWFREAGKI